MATIREWGGGRFLGAPQRRTGKEKGGGGGGSFVRFWEKPM